MNPRYARRAFRSSISLPFTQERWSCKDIWIHLLRASGSLHIEYEFTYSTLLWICRALVVCKRQLLKWLGVRRCAAYWRIFQHPSHLLAYHFLLKQTSTWPSWANSATSSSAYHTQQHLWLTEYARFSAGIYTLCCRFHNASDLSYLKTSDTLSYFDLCFSNQSWIQAGKCLLGNVGQPCSGKCTLTCSIWHEHMMMCLLPLGSKHLQTSDLPQHSVRCVEHTVVAAAANDL